MRDGGLFLEANGQGSVTLYGVSPDAGDFTAALVPDAGLIVNPGAFVPLLLSFRPTKPGWEQETITVSSDNGPLKIQLAGEGIDACATVGCAAKISACSGTCTNGLCSYPSGNTCSDST